MAVEVLNLAETGYEGRYKIATSVAYRGCAVYTSGYHTAGDWMYCNVPTNSAQGLLCEGIVNKYPLTETGSDTAASVDKLTKDSRVVLMKGPGQFKLSGGALVATSWAAVYMSTGWGNGTTVSTAPGDYAYISCIASGTKGAWAASSIYMDLDSATHIAHYETRFRVLQLVGDTSLGVEITLDADWNRTKNVNFGAW